MSGARVRRATAADLDAWVAMRQALWPDGGADGLRGEAEGILRDTHGVTALFAEADGRVVGLAEASLRCEYVNGTLTSPVGFLEACGFEGTGQVVYFRKPVR